MITEFEELYMLVREILNRWDLADLSPGSAGGSPLDEYEFEAIPIAVVLFTDLANPDLEDLDIDDMDIDSVERTVTAVFDQFFRPGFAPVERAQIEYLVDQVVHLIINRPKRQRVSCVCCFCGREVDPKKGGSELLVWRSIHDREHKGAELWAHSDCFKKRVQYPE